MSKGRKGGTDEVDFKLKSGTAWSHNYLNQKPWHPLSYPNQRRKWISEQMHAQKMKLQAEVAKEFSQEQDFFKQAAILSRKDKEKAEAMQAVSFLYTKPPGYNAESARAAEMADEHQALLKKEPLAGETVADREGEIVAVVVEEKRKPRSKDVFGRTIATAEEFAELKNAPKMETGIVGRAKPFGIEIRNVRCARCGAMGHQSGDRECPMQNAVTAVELDRQKREDPLTVIMANIVEEPLKWELKVQPGGCSPPRGGFNSNDANQQILPEDDIFDQYGGFLEGDGGGGVVPPGDLLEKITKKRRKLEMQEEDRKRRKKERKEKKEKRRARRVERRRERRDRLESKKKKLEREKESDDSETLRKRRRREKSESEDYSSSSDDESRRNRRERKKKRKGGENVRSEKGKKLKREEERETDDSHDTEPTDVGRRRNIGRGKDMSTSEDSEDREGRRTHGGLSKTYRKEREHRERRDKKERVKRREEERGVSMDSSDKDGKISSRKNGKRRSSEGVIERRKDSISRNELKVDDENRHRKVEKERSNGKPSHRGEETKEDSTSESVSDKEIGEDRWRGGEGSEEKGGEGRNGNDRKGKDRKNREYGDRDGARGIQIRKKLGREGDRGKGRSRSSSSDYSTSESD